jgi:hypothetical protein
MRHKDAHSELDVDILGSRRSPRETSSGLKGYNFSDISLRRPAAGRCAMTYRKRHIIFLNKYWAEIGTIVQECDATMLNY